MNGHVEDARIVETSDERFTRVSIDPWQPFHSNLVMSRQASIETPAFDSRDAPVSNPEVLTLRAAIDGGDAIVTTGYPNRI